MVTMKMVPINRCFALVTTLEFLLLLGVTLGESSGAELQQPNNKQECSNDRPEERRLTTTTEVWCIARSDVSDVDLQNSLDWACGPLAWEGQANCGPVNVGGSCFDPDTTFHHSSYAFNDYFQRYNGNSTACVFNNTAIITSVDPSQGTCVFPGSNITVNSNGTDGTGAPTPSSSPSSSVVGPVPPPPQSGTMQGFEPRYLVSMSTVVTLLMYLFF